jgi:hypothetical protein
MPKRGQRQVDRPGRNNPTKSQDMTTGTVKSAETFKRQAAEHEDPGKHPSVTKAPHDGPHEGHTLEQVSRLRMQEPATRSGSDSNASGPRKERAVHGGAEKRQPEAAQSAQDFDRDLRPNFLSGQNTRFEGSPGALEGATAADVKEIRALLHDFTADELRAIPILPVGTRLEQGATYLDLMDRGYGPFHGQAGMEASADHYYVPKKALDYVTWNRLTGVTNPDRLDEAADPDQ